VRRAAFAVIVALPLGLADWAAIPTGWLEDRRPVDLLDDDPNAIVTAPAAFDQWPT
jgi:hypothetical protein